MLKVVNPGDGILFMKVGTHAQESLDDIIARKSKEIADAGFAMWGYGGNTSSDGQVWTDIPEGISVRGSRWALLINSLEAKKFTLPLNQTRVPVGPSRGRLGGRYIRGRVDKACLEVLPHPELTNEAEPRELEIGLVAELIDPYSVFLRGER